MLVKAIEASERARTRLRQRLGRAMIIFPLASMAWGIVSGVSITRDYAHSSKLVGYLAALVVVSIGLRLWLDRRARAAEAEAEAKPAGILVGMLRKRPHLVEGAALQVTQYAVQYIIMFCLPLLFLANAWVTFGLGVILVATTIWDGWWLRLARQPWYGALLRCFCAGLATSFAFAVLFPKHLEHFYPALGGVALVSVLPWDALWRRRRPRLPELAPIVVTVLVVVAQALMQSWIRVPLLSVWLRKPALGVAIVDRHLGDAWPRRLPLARLKAALDGGAEICCLTPIVSPSGVAASVVHEWRVNGEVADRIELPAIRGGDDEGKTAFRTYSCKRHLPPATGIKRLECRTFLGGTLYLGRAAVDVD